MAFAALDCRVASLLAMTNHFDDVDMRPLMILREYNKAHAAFTMNVTMGEYNPTCWVFNCESAL